MAFSGLFIRGLVSELRPWLREARIDKIYNFQNELHFYLHNRNEKRVLLVSTEARDYRFQLLATKPQVKYPERPSNFCMLLRRYLPGLPMDEMVQPGLERIITFYFSAGYGHDLQPMRYKLVCELMGKNSNIILVDPEDFILGAARLSSAERNSYREILPGAEYIPPPAQSGKDLLAIDSSHFRRNLLLAAPEENLSQVLVRTVQGLDQNIAHLILTQAELDPQTIRSSLKDFELNRLWKVIEELKEVVAQNHWQPSIIYDNQGKPIDYSPLASDTSSTAVHNSFTELLEAYYADRLETQTQRIEKGPLVAALKKELKRTKRKVAAQERDYASAQAGESYKANADLLMAYLHTLKSGANQVILPSFEDNQPVEIHLDPAKKPIENAEEYYSKYAKAKRKKERSRQELNKTLEYLSYLEQLQEDLRQQESPEDLAAIEIELIALGLLAHRKEMSHNRKKPKAGPQIRTIRLADGSEILVGKNSRQNDYITMSKAKPDDFWFHIKDQPGSHVILKTNNDQLPDETLLTAARLAATYSKAYQATKVEIDYTQKKNVWKPKGAKPGMVLYENYKTLLVKPYSPKELEEIL